jgi:hypothetical protein
MKQRMENSYGKGLAIRSRPIHRNRRTLSQNRSPNPIHLSGNWQRKLREERDCEYHEQTNDSEDCLARHRPESLICSECRNNALDEISLHEGWSEAAAGTGYSHIC